MGNSSSKISSKDKAQLDLKIQRDKLKQYQKKLQLVKDREVEIAKIHLKNNDKKRALLALKKKKYQDQLIDQTEHQLFNLEQLTQQIETAVVQQAILKGLDTGNKVLKELNEELSLERVEQLMDDTKEGLEYQKEVEEILSGKLTLEDEEELERQLDDIIAQEMNILMPEVPQSDLAVDTVSENEKFKPTRIKEKKAKEEEREEPMLA